MVVQEDDEEDEEGEGDGDVDALLLLIAFRGEKFWLLHRDGTGGCFLKPFR